MAGDSEADDCCSCELQYFNILPEGVVVSAHWLTTWRKLELMFKKVHRPSPSLPHFCHFMVHVFLSLPPTPPILPSRCLPPCASVNKGTGLDEPLKSRRGCLIRNSKAFSEHLGRARRQRVARLHRDTGEGKMRKRLARKWEPGSWRAGSAIVPRSLLFHVLASLCLSRCDVSPPNHPFCRCLLVAARQQLW